jgi:phosphoglycolate phosphatase-like HAD superfamily hydrolase
MQKNLSEVKGIIWDLDDTLYSVTPDLHKSMRHAAAKSVVEMGYPISEEDALQLAIESQQKYRLTFKMLYDKFDIDAKDLHIPFHSYMDHTVPDICGDLPAMFEEGYKQGLQHVLMTHASRDWALRMLDRMGIADYFKPEHICGLEDIDFQKKENSDRATRTGLEMMGLNGHQAAFAEDRDYNLTIPYDLGLTTILIDHPSQARELPEHVDYRFKRAADFLGDVLGVGANMNEEKKAS